MLASVPKKRKRDSRMWDGYPTRRNSLVRNEPPPATSNSAVALEKSFPNRLISLSKTPSPRPSTTPIADTLTACVPQAPRTPPTECVG